MCRTAGCHSKLDALPSLSGTMSEGRGMTAVYLTYGKALDKVAATSDVVDETVQQSTVKDPTPLGAQLLALPGDVPTTLPIRCLCQCQVAMFMLCCRGRQGTCLLKAHMWPHLWCRKAH